FPPQCWYGCLLLLAFQMLSLCLVHGQTGSSPPFQPLVKGFHARHQVAPVLCVEPRQVRHMSPPRLRATQGLLGWTAATLARQPGSTSVLTSTSTPGTFTLNGFPIGRLAPEPSHPSMTNPEGNRYPGTDTTFVNDDHGGYVWSEWPDMDPVLKV
ncbi:hypothetical protein Vretimale_8938, partial [Volvox reticuliferus]